MTLSALLHGGAASVLGVAALLVLLLGRRGATTGLLSAAALATAAWAATLALWPHGAPLTGHAAVAEVARTLAWGALLLHLHLRESRAARAPWVAAALVLAVLSLLPPDAAPLPVVGARLGLALLVVLLAENALRGASEAGRWHVNLPAVAVGGLAAFDVVLLADAVLTRTISPALMDARAVLAGLAAPLLVLAALRERRWRRAPPLPGPPVSRAAALHGATFLVGGAFLTGVGAAGEALQAFGGGWAGAARASLLAGAAMAVAVALTSPSARSRVRRALVDPFFRARYDYRSEWMRSIATLSDDRRDAAVRAIRAVADAADSPGGILVLRDEDGAPRWGGSWNAPARPAPDLAPLLHALGEGDRVLPLRDAIPTLRDTYGPLWLAVPLLYHRDGLLGAVLLAPPRAPFPLDDEVCALLRALGREVALFLAERRAAERLVDARRLADYAARFAFVAHDVKTVSGGLKLVLANADDHIADPEFQADMLLTLRAATARIDTLIARLRAPDEALAAALAPVDGPSPTETRIVADAPARLRALIAARGVPAVVDAEAVAPVAMAPEAFDAAVGHLLDNAVEASAPGAPVRLRLRAEHGRPVLDIADRGVGMTPDFVRDELFRPLRTSRPDGNGIGAWQAQRLVRDAGGEVEVRSTPGEGTTMRLLLPPVRAEAGVA